MRAGRARVRTKLAMIVAAGLAGLVVIALFGAIRVRDTRQQLKQDATRQHVETAVALVGSFGARVQDGSMGEREAQAEALSALRALRYDGDQYFWVNDMSPTMLMHPTKPELEGTDLSASTDPDGKFLFLDMVATVQQDGAGFVTYQWPKPGAEEPQPKLSYVAGYDDWGWVIGTGIYVDDLERSFRRDVALSLLALVVLATGMGVLSWRIGRSIAGPLPITPGTLGRVAQGDLTPRFDPTGTD